MVVYGNVYQQNGSVTNSKYGDMMGYNGRYNQSNGIGLSKNLVTKIAIK
jgi:hypothetical protein